MFIGVIKQSEGAIKAGDTVDIGTATTEENLSVSKTGNVIDFSLNKDLKVDSVTAGTTVLNGTGVTADQFKSGNTTIDTNGVTADKVTVGTVTIDKTTNKISGLEAGTDATDAVNLGQLDALSTATDADRQRIHLNE